MNTKRLLVSSLSIAALVVAFSACKKAEVDKDIQSSVDFSVAEMGYAGIVPATEAIGINEGGVNKAQHTCATMSLFAGDTSLAPSANNQIMLMADYGTGCTDMDGRTKSGKVYFNFHGKMVDVGTLVDVTFEDYQVDGIEYTGTMTVTRNGAAQFTSTVSNGVCSSADWTIEYEGTSTYTMIDGTATPDDPADDVFSYENSSTCVNREGRSFTNVTTEPLIKRNSCNWIESGVMELTPAGFATRTYDFGSGTCDASATVTINGNTLQFEMD